MKKLYAITCLILTFGFSKTVVSQNSIQDNRGNQRHFSNSLFQKMNMEKYLSNETIYQLIENQQINIQQNESSANDVINNNNLNSESNKFSGPSSENFTNYETAQPVFKVAPNASITSPLGVETCNFNLSVTITQPAALTVVVTSSTNILCNGASTGAINITAAGGTVAYSFLWSN